MERCPNCHARDPGVDQCRRCGMELGSLLAAQGAARILRQRAVLDLAGGYTQAAMAKLERARLLHRDPFGDLLLGFVRQHRAGSRHPT